MEDRIVHRAIHDMLEPLLIKGKWKKASIDKIDGLLELEYNHLHVKFNVVTKKEIRNYHLPQIYQLARDYQPLMIITEKNIFPVIKKELRKYGIAFIDLNGNADIKTDAFIIQLEGKPQKHEPPENPGRAFTKAGLKAVFLFLQDENTINQPYRTIAGKAGIALGNVKYILEGLKEEGFAIKKTEKTLALTNKKALLEKWLTAYEDKLKPTLHVGNFRFVKPGDMNNWKKLKLNKNPTVWGGEAAGAILTEYLKPEILTLYTTETRNDLIKKYKLVPDIEGNVKVYEKFWNYDTGFNQTTPPILAYADLINTGNNRCIETAQMLYEKYIEDTI